MKMKLNELKNKLKHLKEELAKQEVLHKNTCVRKSSTNIIT